MTSTTILNNKKKPIYLNKYIKYLGTILVKIREKFLDIFYPKFCVNCSSFGDIVCYECISNIYRIKTSTCYYCKKITKFGKVCPSCRSREKVKIRSILIATDFNEGPIREMIHYFKYNSFFEFSTLLGELLAERIKYSGIKYEKFIVVPVPMHRAREAKRGYNQAEILARNVSKRLKLNGGLALVKNENVIEQMKLKRKERLDNLEGKIDCIDEKLIKGKDILLIDDVTTTGATLNECAKVLINAGAKDVYGLVVAKR